MSVITTRSSVLQYKYDNSNVPEVTLDTQNCNDTTLQLGPGVLQLGSDLTKAAVGHTVLPGSIIINWGTVSVSGSSSVTLTFTKAFTTSHYGITAITSSTLSGEVHYSSKGTTTIDLDFIGFTGTVSYLAIGY